MKTFATLALCVSALIAHAQTNVVPGAAAVNFPVPHNLAAPSKAAVKKYTAAKATKGAALLASNPAIQQSTNPPALAGTLLTWSPPPNSFYAVLATTNFETWYCVSNPPLSATSAVIPQVPGRPYEFYRMTTILQTADQGWYVQDLSCFTNAP